MKNKHKINFFDTASENHSNLTRLGQLIHQLSHINFSVATKLNTYALKISTTLNQAIEIQNIKQKKILYQQTLTYVHSTKQYLYKHYTEQLISPKYCILIQKDLSHLARDLENLINLLVDHPTLSRA